MLNRPVSAVPAQRHSQKVLDLIVRALLVLGAVSSLAGIAALVAWVAFTPDVPSKSDLTSAAPAEALTVAEDFLAGRPTAVAVANDIDRTFGRGSSQGGFGEALPVRTFAPLSVRDGSLPATTSQPSGQRFEVHTFLVGLPGEPEENARDGQPDPTRLYALDVTMLLTAQGPVLAAQPALLPYEGPRSSTTRRLDYSQFTTGTQPSQPLVTTAVARWAEAFLANDSDALQAIVRDPGNADPYVGIDGFSLEAAPVIVNSVPVTGEAGTRIVQVTLLVSSERANGFATSLSYDLRVEGTSTQSPSVTAWGPPGSPDLDRYQNSPRRRGQTD